MCFVGLENGLRGTTVNVTSYSVYAAKPYVAFYAGTEGVLNTFLQALRSKVAELGIRVIVVIPGHTGTNGIALRRCCRRRHPTRAE